MGTRREGAHARSERRPQEPEVWAGRLARPLDDALGFSHGIAQPEVTECILDTLGSVISDVQRQEVARIDHTDWVIVASPGGLARCDFHLHMRHSTAGNHDRQRRVVEGQQDRLVSLVHPEGSRLRPHAENSLVVVIEGGDSAL